MLSARHLLLSRDGIFDRPGMELGSLARHESDLRLARHVRLEEKRDDGLGSNQKLV